MIYPNVAMHYNATLCMLYVSLIFNDVTVTDCFNCHNQLYIVSTNFSD